MNKEVEMSFGISEVEVATKCLFFHRLLKRDGKEESEREREGEGEQLTIKRECPRDKCV